MLELIVLFVALMLAFIVFVIEPVYDTLRIRRLKARAKELHLYCGELLDSYGCGHSMGMQMPSYNQAYNEYQEILTKLKLIDSNYPKDRTNE